MDRWKAIGMAAFSYGVLVRSFLSRGLKLASDAGSKVACMQPPSVSPSNRKTIPRTAIATPCSYDFGTPRNPILDSPIQQLTEKSVIVPGLRWPKAHCPRDLLQECRRRPRKPPKNPLSLHKEWAVPASSPHFGL